MPTPTSMAGKTAGYSAQVFGYQQASYVQPVKVQRDFQGDVLQITITNESESKTYFVHKTLLHQKSPYFEALPNFQEGAENHVRFSDIDHAAFDNIVHWFYRDTLDPEFMNDDIVLVNTWAAADRLMMTHCKNVAMDCLRAYFSKRYSTPDLLATLEHLGYTEDTPLSNYLMDQLAYDSVKETVSKAEVRYPEVADQVQCKTMVTLLLKIVARARRKGFDLYDNPSSLVGCQYHEHVEGEKCYLMDMKYQGSRVSFKVV